MAALYKKVDSLIFLKSFHSIQTAYIDILMHLLPLLVYLLLALLSIQAFNYYHNFVEASISVVSIDDLKQLGLSALLWPFSALIMINFRIL